MRNRIKVSNIECVTIYATAFLNLLSTSKKNKELSAKR